MLVGVYTALAAAMAAMPALGIGPGATPTPVVYAARPGHFPAQMMGEPRVNQALHASMQARKARAGVK